MLENSFRLVKKGLKKPSLIPKYLYKKYINKYYGENFRKVSYRGSEYYTWDQDFDWGHYSAPQTSANNYYMYKTLNEYIDEYFENALEFGSGWGNCTSWLHEFSENTHAIDPNLSALKKGREYYPDLHYIGGIGQHMPYQNESFGLVFTNTVLQHIPPSSINTVVSELVRIISKEGKLIIIENFKQGEGNKSKLIQNNWARSKNEYLDMFKEEGMEREHITTNKDRVPGIYGADTPSIYDGIKLEKR